MITNSIPSFNFIIIEKIIESLFLCSCLLLSFIQVQSLIQLLVNIWKSLLQTLKNTLFSTHFMILHNFCLLFLNWQPVVNISHDSQYVAKMSWWSHQMETFSALLALCAKNSPVPGEFPSQRPVTWSSDVSFDLRLNKHWSKQWRGWWFETPSCSLWRHRNGKLKCHCIRLQRIIKQIYIDKDDLHGQWAVGALSQVFKNMRILLSETEQ